VGDAQEAATRNSIHEVAGNAASSSADELSKLAELRSGDVISEEEFQTEKVKVLG
jgi:hypothetical protein